MAVAIINHRGTRQQDVFSQNLGLISKCLTCLGWQALALDGQRDQLTCELATNLLRCRFDKKGGEGRIREWR